MRVIDGDVPDFQQNLDAEPNIPFGARSGEVPAFLRQIANQAQPHDHTATPDTCIPRIPTCQAKPQHLL